MLSVMSADFNMRSSIHDILPHDHVQQCHQHEQPYGTHEQDIDNTDYVSEVRDDGRQATTHGHWDLFLIPQAPGDEPHETHDDTIMFPRAPEDEQFNTHDDTYLFPRAPEGEHHNVCQDMFMFPRAPEDEHCENYQDGVMVSRFPEEELPKHKLNNDINPQTVRQYLLRWDVSSYLCQRAPEYVHPKTHNDTYMFPRAPEDEQRKKQHDIYIYVSSRS